MSKENIEKVIGRLVTDSEFSKKFFEHPDEALKEYNLTEEEKEGLKKVKKEDVSKFSGELDPRISKGSGHPDSGHRINV
jgi:hypothetical protein